MHVPGFDRGQFFHPLSRDDNSNGSQSNPDVFAMSMNPNNPVIYPGGMQLPHQCQALANAPHGSIRHSHPGFEHNHPQPGTMIPNYSLNSKDAVLDSSRSQQHYGNGGRVPSWSGGTVTDVPDKYYPVPNSISGGAPYRQYHPTEKNNRASQGVGGVRYMDTDQQAPHWDALAPRLAFNQCASGRLAIFLENAQCSYELVESDLRELFSYYSGVHCLAILSDYPAAELIVTDPAICAVAAEELNGLVLHGVGTLRCVVMQPGQSMHSILACANIYDSYPHQSSKMSTLVSSNSSVPSLSQNPVLGPGYHGFNDYPNVPQFNVGMVDAAGVVRPFGVPPGAPLHIPPAPDAVSGGSAAPLIYGNVEHVPGITSKPHKKRVCRFELVELFTYEPDFNVTDSILGVNNSNIEYIMRNTGSKVDLSIKGKPLNSAPVAERLHLSITSTDYVAYNKAIEMVEDMLTSVCEKYVSYVKNRGKVVSNLVGFRRHEYEEEGDGSLDYKGSIDKPKIWLDNLAAKKRHKISPFTRSNSRGSSGQNVRQGGPSKKVSGRSRVNNPSRIATNNGARKKAARSE